MVLPIQILASFLFWRNFCISLWYLKKNCQQFISGQSTDTNCVVLWLKTFWEGGGGRGEGGGGGGGSLAHAHMI